MTHKCINCIHCKTCKDRINLDQLIANFISNSHANMLVEGLFIEDPTSNDNLIIKYEMCCKDYIRDSGGEENK